MQGTDKCEIEFVKANTYLTFVTACLAFYIPVAIMIYLYWRIWLETKKRYRDLTTLFLVSGVGGHVGSSAAARLKDRAQAAPQVSSAMFSRRKQRGGLQASSTAAPSQQPSRPLLSRGASSLGAREARVALVHEARPQPSSGAPQGQSAAAQPEAPPPDAPKDTGHAHSQAQHCDRGRLGEGRPEVGGQEAERQPGGQSHRRHAKEPARQVCKCPACPRNFAAGAGGAGAPLPAGRQPEARPSRRSRNCAQCQWLGVEGRPSHTTPKGCCPAGKRAPAGCNCCCCPLLCCPAGRAASQPADSQTTGRCSCGQPTRRPTCCSRQPARPPPRTSSAGGRQSSAPPTQAQPPDELAAGAAKPGAKLSSKLACGYQLLSDNCASLGRSSPKVHPSEVPAKPNSNAPEATPTQESGGVAASAQKLLVDVATSPVDFGQTPEGFGGAPAGGSLASGGASGQGNSSPPFSEAARTAERAAALVGLVGGQHEPEDFETRISLAGGQPTSQEAHPKLAFTFETDDPKLAGLQWAGGVAAAVKPAGGAHQTEVAASRPLARPQWHQPARACCCAKAIFVHDQQCRLCARSASGCGPAATRQARAVPPPSSNADHAHPAVRAPDCRARPGSPPRAPTAKTSGSNGAAQAAEVPSSQETGDLPILDALKLGARERGGPEAGGRGPPEDCPAPKDPPGGGKWRAERKLGQKLTFSDILVDQRAGAGHKLGAQRQPVGQRVPCQRAEEQERRAASVRSLGQLDDDFDYEAGDHTQEGHPRRRLKTLVWPPAWGALRWPRPQLWRRARALLVGGPEVESAHASGERPHTRSRRPELSVANCKGRVPILKLRTGSGAGGEARAASSSSSSSSSAGSPKGLKTPPRSSQSETGAHHAHHHPIQPKSERKAAKTLSTLLLVFIVTWLPYNVLVLIKTLSGGEGPVPEKVWNFSYYLCYINSTINPLCYALCNAQFRRTYMRILKCKLSNEHQKSSTRSRLLPLQSSSIWNKEARLNSNSDCPANANGQPAGSWSSSSQRS